MLRSVPAYSEPIRLLWLTVMAFDAMLETLLKTSEKTVPHVASVFQMFLPMFSGMFSATIQRFIRCYPADYQASCPDDLKEKNCKD